MHRTIVADRYGFRLTVAEDYGYLIEGTYLDPLLARAAQLSRSNGRMRKQIAEVRLPNGLQVHAKYWVPRSALHSMKTLWRRNNIARETAQYIAFQGLGLPVAEFVLSAVRQLPLPELGVYLAGFLATRTVEGGRNLRELLQERRAPWVEDGRDRTSPVLEALAQMLATVHQCGLVHGDFAFKNILFAPDHRESRYQMVDLASRAQPLISQEGTSHYRYRDFLKMVLSIARSGLTQSHALQFLEFYLRAWGGREDSSKGANDLLGLCLSARDHRAREAVHRFALAANQPP